MNLYFIRQLIIHTVCNVTGEAPDEVKALDRVELNTRDWEQLFSRLEATLDIQTGLSTSVERAFSIDALARTLYAKLGDPPIT